MAGNVEFDEVGTVEVCDGAVLHRQVPPQRWCVTQEDLQQFSRLVMKLVVAGQIVPTDLDGFDIGDPAIGPCIHTVNQQLIRPFTDRAGRMSWALMLHPDGLECDLFVTHGWDEGMYEFAVKVLYSWPHGAKHAYCCMLSNPQNLDINDMICSPRDSPFAQALSSSTYMLVVPNHQSSIYSRIWCAYEAFLAYSQEKEIFTASAPPLRIRHQVAVELVFMAVGLATSLAVSGYVAVHAMEEGTISFRYHKVNGVKVFEWAIEVSGGLAFVLFMSVSILRSPASLLPRLFVHLGAASAGVFLGLISRNAADIYKDSGVTPMSLPSFIDTLFGVGICAGALMSGIDRLRRVEANREAGQLRKDYTGRLRDAKASVQADKESIMAELESSGVEKDVEQAVQVLLDCGMSTTTLRSAAFRAGRLGHAGYVNWSMMVIAWVGCAFAPAFHLAHLLQSHYIHAVLHEDCTKECLQDKCVTLESEQQSEFCGNPLESYHVWLTMLAICQLMTWILLFATRRRDSRGFASNALIRIAAATGVLVFVLPMFLARLSVDRNHAGQVIFCCVALPLCLLVSALGPGRTSKMPLIGPWVVRLLLGLTFNFSLLRQHLCWKLPQQQQQQQQQHSEHPQQHGELVYI